MSLSPQVRSESLGSLEHITSNTAWGLVFELIEEQDMNKDARDCGENQEAGSTGAGQTGLSDQERRLAKTQQEEIQLDLDFQRPSSLRGERPTPHAPPQHRKSKGWRPYRQVFFLKAAGDNLPL